MCFEHVILLIEDIGFWFSPIWLILVIRLNTSSRVIPSFFWKIIKTNNAFYLKIEELALVISFCCDILWLKNLPSILKEEALILDFSSIPNRNRVFSLSTKFWYWENNVLEWEVRSLFLEMLHYFLPEVYIVDIKSVF